MKKLFSAFTAVLLAFCFISCAPQELSDRSSKNEGSVSLSIRSPRTISPAEGISYKDVDLWTVTFQDITAQYDDIIVKDVNFNATPSKEIRLPIGTYKIIFEGFATKPESSDNPVEVPFYGEDSVTIEENKPVSKSVFVAPKQSGTGSFNFTVTTSGEFGNYTPIVSGNYFTVSLTPYGGENPVATWTPTKITTSSSTETESVYSFSVSSDTLESKSVPSGIYTLSIKYTWVVGEDSDGQLLTKTKEIYYLNHDFFVEIIDGLTTTGSVNITVSLEESKTYYATTDKTKAEGNGAFESMPGYLDNVLVAVNKTTISEANIYIVDEVLTDGTITYPEIEIDVSKVNEKGKTYCIYTKDIKQPEIYNSTPCYTITGAAVKGGEPTIYIDSSVRTVTLKNSQSSSGISGRAKIVALEKPEFVLKDNTSVFIDLTDVQRAITKTTICMPDSTYNSYYAEHPCVTCVTKDNPNFQVVLERQLLTSYSVVTKSSDDEINKTKTTDFYIIPSYKAGLSVEGIPKYSLVATTKYGSVTADTPLYAGDTVTVTATPTEGSFAEDTTFAWFINGEQRDCTAQSYKITFGDNAEASNTIICLVGYNGKYATAGKELTAVEQTALLYTRNGIGYSNLALLNERSSVTNILNFDSAAYTYISDFCIDTKTNDAYIIFSDESNTYIEKATYYHALTDMHYAAEDFTFSGSESNLIRMGNDNKLYVKFNLIDDLVFGIVELDETAKTVNIISSLIMHEVTSEYQIMSFCVDDAGIMYIAYKDSDNGIQLAKFSIKEGILTKENNILLATISDADNTATSAYFTGISSALTVTDMHYEDGYVYLLVRDASAISRELPKNEVRSLGGVCKIKANDLTFVDNANPLVGWASTTLDITEENGKNVYNYKHLENETLKEYYFYGPQKIIAVKPKEIVIADDGTSIENSSIKPQNRVVVFNLEQNSITDVKTSPKEFFIGTSDGDIYSPYE